MERMRVRLADGAETTLHVVRHDLAATRLRVVRLRRPLPLEAWCAQAGVRDALSGGFYTLDTHAPLGELWTGGFARSHEPFAAPWGDMRACLHLHRGRVRIARRHELPAWPRGDLLQAGPLLVADGLAAHLDGEDPEGFSAGAHQFDSDISAQRHPRAALAVSGGDVLAVACDGRAPGEAGLTLGELAQQLVQLGAEAALNLDGGGSSSLVHDGVLRNAPRDMDGSLVAGGRPLATAITFRPRSAVARAISVQRAA